MFRSSKPLISAKFSQFFLLFSWKMWFFQEKVIIFLELCVSFSVWVCELVRKLGALLLCPCLFHPSDNVWRSQRTDAPQCAHFSTVISSSWITEQISLWKCIHRGASARRECQTSFKIVTWTRQTWTKHHNTGNSLVNTASVWATLGKCAFPV